MNTNSSSRETDKDYPSQRAGDRLTARQQKLLELCRTNGREAVDGLPGDSFLVSEFSEQFIFWSPDGLPRGDSVSVSSSRLGQKLDQHELWFDALRTLAVQIQGRDKFLISSHGTTTHQFVTRIAELFGVPLVEFKPFPRVANAKWFQHVAAASAKNNPASDIERAVGGTVWFEQIQSTANVSQSKPSSESNSKLNIDELLISIANVAVLLSVRKSGKTFAAANRRLELQRKLASQSSQLPPASQESSRGVAGPLKNVEQHRVTKLLISRKLTTSKVESSLLGNGASGWWLYRSDSLDPTISSTVAAGHDFQRPSSPAIDPVILDPAEIASQQYLLHWTRRRVGPWPDQTQTDYLDDLIFRNSRRDHSELSSLCRILASRTILASNDLTRDTKPVVCFSDLPIQELNSRRVFRPHLSRWDFGFYGLAIERDLLEELGARRVVYGNEATWESLANPDRPFFQLQSTSNQKIDWRQEREWRVVGDLRLELIPRERAFVFVASQEQAEVIASLCHWPIVVMDSLKE